MNVNFLQPQQSPFKEVVDAIFQTDGIPAFSDEIILPKGTTEIIFDLSERHEITAQLGDGLGERLPRCFVYSYTRNPIYIQLPRQQTYFGISFQPAALKSLLGAPAGEFANRWTDLTLVDPSFRE